MLNPITFEENAERLKVVIPLKRRWGYWLTYTVLLTVWLAATLWALRSLIRTLWSGRFGFEGLYLFAWFVILAIIAAAWFWLGSKVWRMWQYYTANREILFFYHDGPLIVRRPLSLLGVTDAYDWRYVSPFKFDEKFQSPAFGYGSHRIPVGTTLEKETSRALISHLNERFFPEHDNEDDV